MCYERQMVGKLLPTLTPGPDKKRRSLPKLLGGPRSCLQHHLQRSSLPLNTPPFLTPDDDSLSPHAHIHALEYAVQLQLGRGSPASTDLSCLRSTRYQELNTR